MSGSKTCLICGIPLNPNAGWATCLAHRNSTDMRPAVKNETQGGLSPDALREAIAQLLLDMARERDGREPIPVNSLHPSSAGHFRNQAARIAALVSHPLPATGRNRFKTFGCSEEAAREAFKEDFRNGGSEEEYTAYYAGFIRGGPTGGEKDGHTPTCLIHHRLYEECNCKTSSSGGEKDLGGPEAVPAVASPGWTTEQRETVYGILSCAFGYGIEFATAPNKRPSPWGHERITTLGDKVEKMLTESATAGEPCEPTHPKSFGNPDQVPPVPTEGASLDPARLLKGLQDIITISETAIAEDNPEIMVKIAEKAIKDAGRAAPGRTP